MNQKWWAELACSHGAVQNWVQRIPCGILFDELESYSEFQNYHPQKSINQWTVCMIVVNY